jgi:phosphate-selective porin OprO/OprP
MKKRQRILVLMVAVAAAAAFAGRSYADDTNAAPAATVDDKINRLEQEIQELKHQRELDQQQAQQQAQQQSARAAQPVKPAPILFAGADGFGLQSPNTNFVLRLRGYAQADGRFYFNDKAHIETDTFIMRRVRPILEGTVFRDFDFRIMPDFGNGASSTTILQDAYVEWHYWPWLKVRAGKYKVPVGLEWLEEDRWTTFAERGLPTDLVPQRDVGVQVSGDVIGGLVSYQAGVFNGVVDGGIADADSWDNKDVAARIFVQPFKTTDIAPLKGLGGGISGTYGIQKASSTTTNLATYKTVGQNSFFSFRSGVAPAGPEERISPQGYYFWGPLGILGEYVVAEQQLRAGTDHHYIKNNAWQFVGSFVLTGEDNTYNGVTPRHPFDLSKGTWGAVQLTFRYGDLHVDPDAFNRSPAAADLRFVDPTKSAQDARDWGVGVNWYMNRDIKLVLDYDQTSFHGGAGSATATAYTIQNRETEQIVLGRAQFQF